MSIIEYETMFIQLSNYAYYLISIKIFKALKFFKGLHPTISSKVTPNNAEN